MFNFSVQIRVVALSGHSLNRPYYVKLNINNFDFLRSRLDLRIEGLHWISVATFRYSFRNLWTWSEHSIKFCNGFYIQYVIKPSLASRSLDWDEGWRSGYLTTSCRLRNVTKISIFRKQFVSFFPMSLDA